MMIPMAQSPFANPPTQSTENVVTRDNKNRVTPLVSDVKGISDINGPAGIAGIKGPTGISDVKGPAAISDINGPTGISGINGPTARGAPRVATRGETPLYNYEAERSLLGALMINNRFCEDVMEIVHPDDFADPLHGRIFTAIRKVVDRQRLADPVSLKQYFEAEEALEDIGGGNYLGRLVEEAILTTSATTYAHVIHDLAMRRVLVATASELIARASQPDVDMSAGELIESAEQALYRIGEEDHRKKSLIPLNESIEQALHGVSNALKNYDRISGLASGFHRIDQCLGGLQSSDLVIIAARPSMGKTALATNIAWHAASCRLKTSGKDQKDGKGGGIVAYFSLEMSAEQLVTRILCELTGINATQIRLGNIKQADYDKIFKVSKEIEAAPLYIDETPALNVATLRNRARRLKRTRGLDLIVVDYLQLLSGSGTRRSQENRVLEISEISRSLKALAKELNVPVIALSQLSRKVEDRDDKRPQLADLRESGAIEQDADVVMFIYREAYYVYRSKPREPREGDREEQMKKFEEWKTLYQNVARDSEIMIAKNRHGRVETLHLNFDENFTRFTNPAQEDHLPESM